MFVYLTDKSREDDNWMRDRYNDEKVIMREIPYRAGLS